jgi:hypothetical protein
MFCKRWRMGGKWRRRRDASKSINRFSSSDITQHQCPSCLFTLNIVRRTCIGHKIYVSIFSRTYFTNTLREIKLSLYQAVEAHSVARRWGSHSFRTIDSQMAVKLLVLRTVRPLPQGRLMVLISVGGWVDPRDIVWLEGLRQLKNLVTSSRIEPPTFRLVA